MITSGTVALVGHVLQYLLISFWYLCTFAAAITALDLPFPRAFKDAVKLSAARGKTWDGKPSSLGFLKDVSVPHVWFWHFYFVGMSTNMFTLCIVLVPLVARAVSPTFEALLIHQNCADDPKQCSLEALTCTTVTTIAITCMLQTHLVRRLLETMLMFRYPEASKMHILAYLYGMAYYIVLSLTFVPPETITTSISLILRVPPRKATEGSLSQLLSGENDCNDPTSSCDYVSDVGLSLLDGAVLTPVTAIGMIENIVHSIIKAFTSDMGLLMGGVMVALGQLIQHDSHRRLAALSAGTHTRSQDVGAKTQRTDTQGVSLPASIRVTRPAPDPLPQPSTPSARTLNLRASRSAALLDASPSQSYLASPTTPSPVAAVQTTNHPSSHMSAFSRLQPPASVTTAFSNGPMSHAYDPGPLPKSHSLSVEASSLCRRASAYKVPSGGLFELVSCPHYLGEIVIYCGFCMMRHATGLSAVVLAWVVLNLMIGARDNHTWYRASFKDYPSHRKALIPYLY